MSGSLLVASHNRGKVSELRALLTDLWVTVVSLADIGISEGIEESGNTFRNNAILKAAGYSALTGQTCLADDSGLVIDALNGEPGVHSARYAGPNSNDAQRIELVLRKMRDVPEHRRSARFVCAVAIASPGDLTKVVEASVDGQISMEPRGTQGFGYDPIFYFPPAGRTFGEMTTVEKDTVSHRSLAIRQALPLLVDLKRAGILG